MSTQTCTEMLLGALLNSPTSKHKRPSPAGGEISWFTTQWNTILTDKRLRRRPTLTCDALTSSQDGSAHLHARRGGGTPSSGLLLGGNPSRSPNGWAGAIEHGAPVL